MLATNGIGKTALVDALRRIERLGLLDRIIDPAVAVTWQQRTSDPGLITRS
jgi:hypothetical protein